MQITVKPKDGVLVRDPNTMRIVPPEGIQVSDDNLYYARLVLDGDFVVVKGSK